MTLMSVPHLLRGIIMAQVDYSPLDDPAITMNSFHPRQSWTPPPEGVQDYTINVGDDIGLSCRFFPVEALTSVGHWNSDCISAMA